MLLELNDLATHHPKARRFSSEMIEFGYTLNAISARSYRHGCGVFPFPSARTIFNHFQGEKAIIRCALSECPDLAPLKEFLHEFRGRERLPEGLIACTLAFDATSVTATGLPNASHKGGSSFAFMMLPLDHRIPDLLIRSIVRPNGKMNKGVLAAKDELSDVLRQCDFVPHFVATDGDNGMDAAHALAFDKYKDLYKPDQVHSKQSFSNWRCREI
jgi:hypothetical protein